MLSEILPTIPIKLTTTLGFEDNTMSYQMLNWTVEGKTGVTDFMLQINNSKNISICANKNRYFFQKEKMDAVSLSIFSVDKCNRISGMSNNVSLLPSIICKSNTSEAFKNINKTWF